MTTADRPNSKQLAALREEFDNAIGRGVEEADIYRHQLVQRVKKYERRYEMASDEMLEQLASGQLRETRDISAWAWDFDLLTRLGR